MQSSHVNVDDYLTSVPPDRLEALTTLRALCREHLPGYVESMTYGMPCYARDGVQGVAFNSQKQYISLYIGNKTVLDRYRNQLKNAGKGCIRYKKAADIDFDLVRTLLRETAASDAEICP
jgi:uncharacterized protein YdhG (YjbR/CyaY superfamily)